MNILAYLGRWFGLRNAIILALVALALSAAAADQSNVNAIRMRLHGANEGGGGGGSDPECDNDGGDPNYYFTCMAAMLETERSSDFRTQSGINNAQFDGVDSRVWSLSSLTFSGTTATATTLVAYHGFKVGQQVTMARASGADATLYNITATITSVPAYNQFTYTMSGTPSANAVGSASATGGEGTAHTNGEENCKIFFTNTPPLDASSEPFDDAVLSLNGGSAVGGVTVNRRPILFRNNANDWVIIDNTGGCPNIASGAGEDYSTFKVPQATGDVHYWIYDFANDPHADKADGGKGVIDPEGPENFHDALVGAETNGVSSCTIEIADTGDENTNFSSEDHLLTLKNGASIGGVTVNQREITGFDDGANTLTINSTGGCPSIPSGSPVDWRTWRRSIRSNVGDTGGQLRRNLGIGSNMATDASVDTVFIVWDAYWTDDYVCGSTKKDGLQDHKQWQITNGFGSDLYFEIRLRYNDCTAGTVGGIDGRFYNTPTGNMTTNGPDDGIDSQYTVKQVDDGVWTRYAMFWELTASPNPHVVDLWVGDEDDGSFTHVFNLLDVARGGTGIAMWWAEWDTSKFATANSPDAMAHYIRFQIVQHGISRATAMSRLILPKS